MIRIDPGKLAIEKRQAPSWYLTTLITLICVY